MRDSPDPESFDWSAVRRLTVVPFLPDGRCALVPGGPDGEALTLPSGEVLPGEDPLLDTALRVPLVTAGFRRQGVHLLAADGDHAAIWSQGDDRYRGAREHATVTLWTGPAAEAARRLRARGDDRAAALVEAADRARRSLDDAAFFRDGQRLLEASYLRATTAEGGSGFGGSPERWRAHRSQISEAIDRDGSFLDVGCANGHLMDSMVAWCAERGLAIEPHGVDLSPGLVDAARRRLPRWADRIWVGNALDWVPPDGRRFDAVHVLLDLVPGPRLGEMLAHQLDRSVAPGGRLLATNYVPAADTSRHPVTILTRLGFEVAGVTREGGNADQPVPGTAWIARA